MVSGRAKGGYARAAVLTPERRREIARMGGFARQGAFTELLAHRQDSPDKDQLMTMIISQIHGLDINAPGAEVEVEIQTRKWDDRTYQVLYVHVNGLTVMRVSQIEPGDLKIKKRTLKGT